MSKAVTGTETTTTTSYEQASYLSAVLEAAYADGELAYIISEDRFYYLKRTAIAPAGLPTRSGFGRWVPLLTGGGGGSATVTDHFVVATTGITTFVLSAIPSAPLNALFIVNGVTEEYGVDFSISGNVATWLASYSLEAGWIVVIQYQ